jgi:prevent-host-death family protein
MKRPLLDRDIRPLSEFRARVATCLRQARRTQRPIVITHRGRCRAVLLDVATYEALLQRVELLEDVRAGESQIDAGQGISHRRALRKVLSKIGCG